MRTARRTLCLIVCAGLAVGAAGCSNPNAKADEYSDEVRENFMATCTESVQVDAEKSEVTREKLASTTYCECVYEAVSDSQQIPIGDLNDFEDEMAKASAEDAVDLSKSDTGKKLESIVEGCADASK